MKIINPKTWYSRIPQKKIETEYKNYKLNNKMKNLFFWECIIHFIGAMAAIVGFFHSINDGWTAYLWQIFALIWVISSFFKAYTIKKMEKRF